MPRNGERGFTMIEILVVLLIVAVLSAIAIPLFMNRATKAQDADAKSAVTSRSSISHGRRRRALVKIDLVARGLRPRRRRRRRAVHAVWTPVAGSHGGTRSQHHDVRHPPVTAPAATTAPGRDAAGLFHDRRTRLRASTRRRSRTIGPRQCRGAGGALHRRHTAMRARRHGNPSRVARREHCPAMGRPPAALRGHRRRGDERPRARRARARRGGDRLGPRRRLAVRRARCARPASSRSTATTPANVPAGAEVVVSTRDPAREPGARGRARARPARAAPRRPARRAHAAAADDRRHRHPRQDDDVEHGRPRAARLRAGPGYLVGGEVRSTGANAGWGAGEWLVVEADESDRSLLKLDARGSRCSRTPSSTTTRPTRSQRDVDDDVPGVPRARPSTRSSGTGRSCCALAGAAARRRSTPTPELDAGRLALRARRRRRWRCTRPGRPQRAATPPPR